MTTTLYRLAEQFGLVLIANRRWISFIVLCMVLGAAVAGLAGCDSIEPTVTSPISGKQVSGQGLIVEVEQAERDAKAKADAEDRAERARLRRLQADATAKALQIASDRDRADADARAAMALLRATTEAEVADIAARSEDRATALAAQMEALSVSVQEASEQIRIKSEQRTALAKFVLDNPFVKSAAASVGIDTGGLLPLAGGVGGTMLLGWHQRRRERQSWDEAKNEDATKAKATSDADLRAKLDRLLAILPPELAAKALTTTGA